MGEMGKKKKYTFQNFQLCAFIKSRKKDKYFKKVAHTKCREFDEKIVRHFVHATFKVI